MNTTCMNPTLWGADDRAEEAIQHESTYALLVRSEEKERSFLEMAFCFLCALSVIAAIWQFAHQAIALPLDAATTATANTTALVSATPNHCTNGHG